MREIREILRQKWQLGHSHRQIGASVGRSPSSVGELLGRSKIAGLTDWGTICGLTEAELIGRLYPKAVSGRPEPDFSWVHRERRKTGVTLALLHLEYAEANPKAHYGYTQFCDGYRKWLKRRGVTMRQVHRAGDKTFVDYSGKRPCIWDEKTGERIDLELFVAVLGASNYTYAEASRTQQGPDFIASHSRTFEYFGGVTAAVVPDQLRSAVTQPCRYDPGVQKTYDEWADHFGTAIMPARPGHPRDKAKVETAVQIAQRWILARLRNERHFSLASLNERIWELCDDLNVRKMRVYGKSRSELFDLLDRPALRPLPEQRFQYGIWKGAKVNIDYHVEYEGHYYSVPHRYVGEHVEIRIGAVTLEVFSHGQRIASHARNRNRGAHTTVAEHMPKAHRAHMEWTPTRIINWATTIGPYTRTLAEAILAERPHPEMGYRSCLGILRLAKSYGPERLEAASARALWAGGRSYRHVQSILKKGLDRMPMSTEAEKSTMPDHENVRGPTYYN